MSVEIQLQRTHRRLKHSAAFRLDTVYEELRLDRHRQRGVETTHVEGALLVDETAHRLFLSLELFFLVFFHFIRKLKELSAEFHLQEDVLIDLRTFFL